MNKILSFLTIGLLAISLQSCGEDPKPTIKSNDLSFTAVNTVSPKELHAQSSGAVVNLNWTVTVTINGVATTVTGTSKSDELPVMAGDVVDLTFQPSKPEEKQATFSMPDGTTKTVTAVSPTFSWTVPANFTPGMKISAANRFETDDTIYEQSGAITLVAIE